MSELTPHFQDEVPRCELFAYDIVLVEGSKDGVNTKLERRQEALESKFFKISNAKKRYMDCNFGGDVQRIKIAVVGGIAASGQNNR